MGTNMIRMTVDGLVTDPKTDNPMVWLGSAEDDVKLAIVIGKTEAMSINAELSGEPTPRPLTQDLFRSFLDHIGAQVEETRILELRDTTFYAEVVFSYRGEQIRLDARPSDGIALALKYRAPILAAQEVLKRAGIKVNEGWRKAMAKVKKARKPAAKSEKREYKTEDSAKKQKTQWERKGFKVTRRKNALYIKK